MCMGHLVHQTNITQMCVCAVRQMSLPKGKENGIVQLNNELDNQECKARAGHNTELHMLLGFICGGRWDAWPGYNQGYRYTHVLQELLMILLVFVDQFSLLKMVHPHCQFWV